jgi:hypothetical protein
MNFLEASDAVVLCSFIPAEEQKRMLLLMAFAMLLCTHL